MSDITGIHQSSYTADVGDVAGKNVKQTDATGAEPTITLSKAEENKLDQLMSEALGAMHDIEPPDSMNPEEVISYLDQMSAKLATIGSKLAKEVLKAANEKVKTDTEKRNQKIHDNFAKMRKMEKKQKLFKALGWLAAGLSVLVTAATLGSGAPLAVSVCAVVGATAAVASTVIANTNVMELMHASPKVKQAIQIMLMVIQMAMALASIASALKGALTAGEKAAELGIKAGAAGVEGAGNAAGSALESATQTVIENATKAAVKEAMKEVVENAAKTAAREISKEVTEEVTKDVAQQVAKQAVSKAVQQATEKVAMSAIDKMAEVASKTGVDISREVGEEVARQVAEQVAKEIAKEIGEQVGTSVAKAAVKEVAEEAIKQATEAAVKNVGKYAATKVVCEAIASGSRLTEAGTAVVKGVETAEMGKLTQEIGINKKDLIKLAAKLQLSQQVIEKMIDWVKDIGKDYMSAEKKVQELMENFHSAAMLGTGDGLGGPGANAM